MHAANGALVARRLPLSVVAHLHDSLDQVVAVHVEDHGVELLGPHDVVNDLLLLLVAGHEQHLLDHSTAVGVHAELLQFAHHSLHDEVRLLVVQVLEALLDHVVSVLVLNQLEHVDVLEFVDEEVPLVLVGELEGLLNDSAAVLAAGQLHHLAQDLVDDRRLLPGTAELDEFLDDVIPEDVVHQLLDAGDHLLKHEVFEGLVLQALRAVRHEEVRFATRLVLGLVESILDEATALLVHCALVHVASQDMVVEEFTCPDLLNQVLQKRTSHDLRLTQVAAFL